MNSATPVLHARNLELAATTITYIEYRAILGYYLEDRRTAGPLDFFKTKLLEPVLAYAQRIVSDYGVQMDEVLGALKRTKTFQFLKAIRFKLDPLLKGIKTAFKLTRMGLDRVTKEIAQSGILAKLRDGTMKVDEFLKKYPIVKQVAGPVLAGLLLWCWLNMSFIGDPQSDFDLMDVANAFLGKFTLTDLLTSQAGIENILLTVFGLATGISFPWIGTTAFQLFVAVIATGLKGASKSQLFRRIRKSTMTASVHVGSNRATNP